MPADPDEFLNQLDETAVAHVADPYWAAIWAAAPSLAECVCRHKWPQGSRALELGCGVGLVGLAALAAGLSITFSDYLELAVELAVENARRNGFARADGLVLDWRDPPTLKPFPLVLASDVLYETERHSDLLATLDRVLADDGQCWIGDPVRAAAMNFVALARERGYDVTLEREVAGSPGTKHPAKFQLLVLRRRPA